MVIWDYFDSVDRSYHSALGTFCRSEHWTRIGLLQGQKSYPLCCPYFHSWNLNFPTSYWAVYWVHSSLKKSKIYLRKVFFHIFIFSLPFLVAFQNSCFHFTAWLLLKFISVRLGYRTWKPRQGNHQVISIGFNLTGGSKKSVKQSCESCKMCAWY